MNAWKRLAPAGITHVPLGHVARGPGEALGLVFVSAAAVFGIAALILFDASRQPGRRSRRSLAMVMAGLTAVTVVLAYIAPVVVKGRWTAGRPKATARLEILSPTPGSVFRGDPVAIPIQLRLTGGKIVSTTSATAVPNIGHVHVYLDGKLVSMSPGLGGRILVRPGEHELEADFVASDHSPFNPPVRSVVSFTVAA